MTTTTIEPRTVAELLATETDPWRGPSGEHVTGESVATHLEATIALLERDGWARTYAMTETGTEEGAPGDTSTVRDMLRWLIRIVRAEYETTPRTLDLVLSTVSGSASGDQDTAAAAGTVLQAVLRARTGARYVAISAWAGRLDRTWPQVRDLLVEAAEAARAYGPAA